MRSCSFARRSRISRVARITAERAGAVVSPRITIAQSIALLAAGEIVAIPTETVYGLAADAANPQAVARVFAAKGRPAFNPLIAHVLDAAMAAGLVDIEPLAAELMARWWPGPLTLVLPVRPDAPVAALARAGLSTLAVRATSHELARAVIAGSGRALVAPSANASGGLSPTRAGHVTLDVPVLDGGACELGVESTIVSIADGRATLLRPGAIPAEALDLSLDVAGPAILAPGQMASHYAPHQPVRLAAMHAGPDEFLIGFGEIAGHLSLSPTGNPVEAAARLFEVLHLAQASGRTRIAVAPVPETGLGVAINDRLRRAAAPRE